MSSFSPPIAPKLPFFHSYHGKQYEDKYHWLKDTNPTEKRTEVTTYIKKENEYCDNVHKLPNAQLTEKIYAEILSRINEDDVRVPVTRGEYIYYSRSVKGHSYPLYCRRKNGLEEEVMLDLNLRTDDYIGLGGLEVSNDHLTVAYSLDLDGSEKYTIYFKNLESGVVSDKVIVNTTGEICWAQDNETVWYSTLDATQRPDKIFRHNRLGKEADVLIFHEADEKFIAHFALSLSKQYLIVGASSSRSSECYILPTATPKGELRLVRKREEGHEYEIEHQGSRFLILTDGGKKYLNKRLVSCDADNLSEWKEELEYDPLVELVEICPFEDHLAILERRDGMKQIRIFESKNGHIKVSSSHYIPIPAQLYNADISHAKELNYDSSILRFSYETPLAAQKVMQYDMSTLKATCLKETIVPGSFDASLYEMKRLYAPIALENQVKAPFDTPVPTSVPISLVYRKDLFKGDGSNPMYLYGYGSYGISIDNYFSASKISLLDRGFVFAIAHIRGGGDCGKGWYNTGKFLNKKSSFVDFIACAKYLIAKNYTSKEVLAIDGRSAGGLLIGAVINMEPDLFAVAVAGVPFVDVINTMMDPTIPLTINEYEEWGNPNDLEYFNYMLSYCPYEQIPAGKTFPHLLFKAGLFDPRVAFWEPAKFIAKARELNMDGDGEKTFVLDTKLGSGHFGSSGRYSYIKEISQDYAFVVSLIEKIVNKKG